MPDYQQGKIYKLVNIYTGQTYIGSTTQPLSYRLSGHRSNYKQGLNCSSAALFETGIEDVAIELVVDYPCSCLEELQDKEYEIINQYDCVNKLRRKYGVPKYKKKEYQRKKYLNRQQYEINRSRENSKINKYCEVCDKTVKKKYYYMHEKSIKHIKNSELNVNNNIDINV